jgi:hypothetical protein
VSEKNIFALAAGRAKSDPLFLGHYLHEYCQIYSIGPEALSKELRCSVKAIEKLCLCLRPDPISIAFRADIERISLHCDVDGHRLMEILREVDSVLSMRNAPAPPSPLDHDASALLMAARDRQVQRPASRRKERRKKKQ